MKEYSVLVPLVACQHDQLFAFFHYPNRQGQYWHLMNKQQHQRQVAKRSRKQSSWKEKLMDDGGYQERLRTSSRHWQRSTNVHSKVCKNKGFVVQLEVQMKSRERDVSRSRSNVSKPDFKLSLRFQFNQSLKPQNQFTEILKTFNFHVFHSSYVLIKALNHILKPKVRYRETDRAFSRSLNSPHIPIKLFSSGFFFDRRERRIIRNSSVKTSFSLHR